LPLRPVGTVNKAARHPPSNNTPNRFVKTLWP
jgi:hypothetical protein